MYKIIEGRHVTLSKTCNLSCLNMNDNTIIILTQIINMPKWKIH